MNGEQKNIKKIFTTALLMLLMIPVFNFSILKTHAQDDTLPIGNPDEAVREIFEPSVSTFNKIKNFTKSVSDKISEWKLGDLWSNMKVYYESFSNKFESVTGVTLAEAIKKVGSFFASILELIAKVIKRGTSFL